MPARCVAMWCSNSQQDGVSLHSFPLTQPSVLAQWTRFVQVKRNHWKGPSTSSKLCSAHFSADCFDLIYKGEMGLGRRKVLVKGAVPTIHTEKPPELQQQTKKKRALQLGDGTATATGCGITIDSDTLTVQSVVCKKKARPGRAIQKLTVNRV